MLNEMRRIVTGTNQAGRSFVVSDGPPAKVAESENGGVAEIWVTDRAPADNKAPGDLAASRKIRLEPPPRGSVFRYFTVMPEDPATPRDKLEKVLAARFEQIDGTHCRVDTSRHPSMHTTRTVDYIILLSGEVTLLLDEGKEIHMKPFDVVVQRGTNHGWVNHSSKPALLAAILIDSEPV
jgi:hypothetical protein